MSSISKSYDLQLAASVQRDYVQRAANHRLGKEAGAHKGIVSATYNFVSGLLPAVRGHWREHPGAELVQSVESVS